MRSAEMRREHKVKLIVNYQLLFYDSSYDHFLHHNKTCKNFNNSKHELQKFLFSTVYIEKRY